MSGSVGVPAFEATGLLPDGVYPCDEETFEQRFVTAFPTSSTRSQQYTGFLRLRSEAEQIPVSGVQWIDGSFVTSKLDPGDIDLVTFVDFDMLNMLTLEQQELVLQLLKAEQVTRPRYGCHTFLVPSCAPGHPFHSHFEQGRVYWRTWFGKTRDTLSPAGTVMPGVAKGFISMPLGGVGTGVAIATERSTQ